MNTLSDPITMKNAPGRLACSPDISPKPSLCITGSGAPKQRGVVLFFTLVALLAMSLAVVALIRSVDTGAIIAGNLAFRQGATIAADAGVESAMGWLRVTNDANVNLNIMNNLPAVHPFNVDNGALGYYSNTDPELSFTDPSKPKHINWISGTDSVCLPEDANGNTVCYVIQRMCRDANVPTQNTRCLYASSDEDLMQQNIPYPQDICDGDGCPIAGQAPMLRVTTRSVGPRNSISYVQVFVH